MRPSVPDPLPDGTPLADLQAAMQAAWIAGEKHIAAELSKRYGLYNKLCLRCGVPWQPLVRTGSTDATDCWPDSYLARLCQPCAHEEVRPYRSNVKPVSYNMPMQMTGDWSALRESLKRIAAEPALSIKFIPPIPFKADK